MDIADRSTVFSRLFILACKCENIDLVFELCAQAFWNTVYVVKICLVYYFKSKYYKHPYFITYGNYCSRRPNLWPNNQDGYIFQLAGISGILQQRSSVPLFLWYIQFHSLSILSNILMLKCHIIIVGQFKALKSSRERRVILPLGYEV